MTVYVLHPVKDDISSATEYGEIAYLNKRYVYTDELDGERIPSQFLLNMASAVDKFDIDHDYLLIAGDHLQLVQMAALLADRWGTFNVLRFDRAAGGYAAVEIITEI